MAKTRTGKLTTPEIEQVNRDIDAMIEAGLEDFRGWKVIYDDGMNYIYNNQLANKTRKEGWDPIQANYVFPATTQEQALLAQRRPTIRTKGFEDSDHAGAEIWGKVLQWQFEEGLKIPHVLLEAMMDGKTHGHWVVKASWNRKAEWLADEKRWKGGVELHLMRPEAVGVDRHCEKADLSDAEFAYTRRRMSVQEIVNKWPKSEEAIRAAARSEAEGQDAIGGGLERMSAASSKAILDGAAQDGERDRGIPEGGIQGRLASLLSGRESLRSERDRIGEGHAPTEVTVVEIWWKDRTEVDEEEPEDLSVEELIERGLVETRGGGGGGLKQHYVAATGELLTEQNTPQPVRKYTRPVFPRGRHAIRVGKTILNAEIEDQVWNYRTWMLCLGVNQMLPHTYHGLNGVEMPRGLQDWVNETLAHLLNHVKQFGDPINLVEEGALTADPQNRNVAEHIASRAGAIIPLSPGGLNKFRRDPPPNMSNAVPTAYKIVTGDLRDQTGQQEISLGRASPGGAKETATASINQMTNSRLRTALQSILLDDFTVRLMDMVQELMARNVHPQDMLRITGDEQDPSSVILSIEQVDAHFDLRLEVTTTLPFDEERKRQNAIQLYQLVGMPYLRRLLEAFDEENIDELLAQVELWVQLEAMAAAQEESPGQPGAPGGAGAGPPKPSAHPDAGGGAGKTNAFNPQGAVESALPNPG